MLLTEQELENALRNMQDQVAHYYTEREGHGWASDYIAILYSYQAYYVFRRPSENGKPLSSYYVPDKKVTRAGRVYRGNKTLRNMAERLKDLANS